MARSHGSRLPNRPRRPHLRPGQVRYDCGVTSASWRAIQRLRAAPTGSATDDDERRRIFTAALKEPGRGISGSGVRGQLRRPTIAAVLLAQPGWSGDCGRAPCGQSGTDGAWAELRLRSGSHFEVQRRATQRAETQRCVPGRRDCDRFTSSEQSGRTRGVVGREPRSAAGADSRW
jgi:hypothetical protein